MDIEVIQHQKQKVIENFGEWTAHNIRLDNDIYTIAKKITGDEIKLRRVIQIVSDIAGKPLSHLRVLDLACLEGLYTIELAKHGAEVVAIEGRKANIEKARFSKEILSLSNVALFQDDVRNLNAGTYGHFDVVLCLGILYHLDVSDVFSFLENVFQVCKGFVVIDTHVSLSGRESCIYRKKEYWGHEHIEHKADSSPQEREKSLWASLDNPTSFWFTRPSLLNLLSNIGFSSVYECHIPEEPQKPCHRSTLVAIKGQREKLISAPLMNAQEPIGIPEESGHQYSESLFSRLFKVRLLILRKLKEIVKKLVFARRLQ